MTTDDFIYILGLGLIYGFGFSAFFGLIGYAMQSIKKVIFDNE